MGFPKTGTAELRWSLPLVSCLVSGFASGVVSVFSGKFPGAVPGGIFQTEGNRWGSTLMRGLEKNMFQKVTDLGISLGF